jgi:hypothetical protein
MTTNYTMPELERAARALTDGQFRDTAPEPFRATAVARRSVENGAALWSPSEVVIPVIGASSGAGATTLCVALATAASARARVVECCSSTRSGLAAAATSELGVLDQWRRGTRPGNHGPVLLERTALPVASLNELSVPVDADTDGGVDLTFLDCASDVAQILAEGWVTTQVLDAPVVVVAAEATVPGIRHLEVALEVLSDAGVANCIAAVRGPSRKKWPRPVEASLAASVRSLDAQGLLIEIPTDATLAVAGIDRNPLPRPLLDAAARLNELLPLGHLEEAALIPEPLTFFGQD